MKVNNNIQYHQQPVSFRALTYNKEVQAIKYTIEYSKALQKFGKKYNANIDYVQLSSKQNETHPAFMISNIVPIGIQKIIDKIKKVNAKDQFMYITTRGTKYYDLHRKLSLVPEDYITKKYQKAFSEKK